MLTYGDILLPCLLNPPQLLNIASLLMKDVRELWHVASHKDQDTFLTEVQQYLVLVYDCLFVVRCVVSLFSVFNQLKS